MNNKKMESFTIDLGSKQRTFDETIDYLEGACIDPHSPIYASDIAEALIDLIEDDGLLVEHLTEKDNVTEKLREWVNDLQSGMFINCVYCGHRYGPNDEVPASMADVLKEHIPQCPEHPMSHLKTSLAEKESTIKKLEFMVENGLGWKDMERGEV